MGKSEMGSPGPGQLLDSGLCGLSLVAGYYRIAGDPTQLRHQLALTGRRAQAEDVVRGANVLQLKSRILRGVTAKRLGAIPFPAILSLKDGGFAVLGAGSTKGMARLVDPIARTAQAGGHSGAVFRRTDPDHAPIWRGGARSHHIRVPLVLALDSPLPAPPRPCARRIAVCTIVRSGHANLFPTHRG